jgi:hypothetical protein
LQPINKNIKKTRTIFFFKFKKKVLNFKSKLNNAKEVTKKKKIEIKTMNNNSFGEVNPNICKNKQTTFKIKIQECKKEKKKRNIKNIKKKTKKRKKKKAKCTMHL